MGRTGPRWSLWVGALLFAVLAALPGRAAAADMSKLAAWAIGHNLSLAAMLYAQDSPQQNIDPPLAKAKKAAEAVNLDIKPFPPKSGTRVETMAAVIQYLIKGDGWSTGEALVKKYSLEHGTLFEIAVKSNMGLVMYQPDNDHGIAKMLEDRAGKIKLPPELWTPVVGAIKDKRPQPEVQKAIAKMHEDVAAKLLQDTK